MKRTIFSLALLLLFCTACSSSQIENTPASPSSTSSAADYSFDDYNILSTSCISRTQDEFNHQETWNVTNTSDDILTYIDITVTYYDSNNNIVYTDGRSPQVSLKPNQSIQIDSYCDKDYASSEVTNFSYEPSSKINDTYDGVNVDLVSKQVDFWTH